MSRSRSPSASGEGRLKSALKQPGSSLSPSPSPRRPSSTSATAPAAPKRKSVVHQDDSDDEDGASSSESEAEPSTPPLASYERRVGFDTFESGRELASAATGGGTGVVYAFSIGAKSPGYSRSRDTRSYLVATDLETWSSHALEWCVENLAESGDEIVILRGIESGSPAHDQWRQDDEGTRRDAENLLQDVMMRIDPNERKVSVKVEFAIGRIQDLIHRMIEIYKPDSLIVGTRGLSGSLLKRQFMGSISRYCVARAPVPTIVVRPEDKIKKSLEARVADDKRRSYLSLMMLNDETGGGGGLQLQRTRTRLMESSGRSSRSPSRERPASPGGGGLASKAKVSLSLPSNPLTRTRSAAVDEDASSSGAASTSSSMSSKLHKLTSWFSKSDKDKNMRRTRTFG